MTSALRFAWIYNAYQSLIGGRSMAYRILKERAPLNKKGVKILDLGCGTAELLHYLPEDVEYTGIDASAEYLVAAQKKFPHARFIQADLTTTELDNKESFDVIAATGLLHHLSDNGVIALLQKVKKIMHLNSVLITSDNCITAKQRPIARWLAERDRGEYVRTPEQYSRLALSVFDQTEETTEKDLLRIPFDCHVMIMRKSR